MYHEFYRGDIFWISEGRELGCEQIANRPGIIVSNDKNNQYSQTVEVVMLTRRPKNPLPTHVRINSAKYPSTALCEQITTVAKERLTRFIGSITDREQERIDEALRVSIAV